ncbi:MAG: hemerythrin domain-containing protein [Oxalobacteraceae bacterium]|nr:hemerythrin domain-containing protein [Oxalobacteraceae bacterium]
MRVSSNHIAIRVIQDEHDRLSAVIHGMQYFVRAINKTAKAPEPKVFRAMMLYISEYPEKVHHPKEDQYLFSRLRLRTDQVNQTLDELESQHAQGESQAHALECALTHYELEGAAAFQPFFDMVEAYAKFYFSHMGMEEDAVLPAAVKFLTPDDWAVIDAQFAANADPLAGGEYKESFDKLFSLIVNITPAPLGLGPAI